jgi:deoxyguanosine kinase
MILSLEGDIGSGKSTLLEKANTHFKNNRNNKICVYPEEVELWKQEGWLDLFYRDKIRYSLGLQLRVMKSQQDIYKKMDHNKVNITERCPLTNEYVFGKSLHDDNILHNLEYKLCNDIRQDYGWIPDRVIYLKASTDTCLNRIMKRSRKEEANINIGYIDKINEAYDNYIFHVLPEKYEIAPIILDAEKDSDSLLTEFLALLPE